MKSNEIISIIITLIGLISFATLFTFLYKSFANSAIKDVNSGKRDMELIQTIVESNGKKKRKVAGIFKSVIFYLIMIMIIPIFIFSMINKASGKVNSFNGKSVLVVASGSMSEKNKDNTFVNDPSLQQNYNMDNQFSKFDMIVIKEVNDPSEINLYDVIAFRSKKGDIVIHRVVNIHGDNKDNISYVTQGDALAVEDGLRPNYDDVIGVYTSKRIKGIGAIILFCQSSAGIITILSLIYILSMLEYMNNKITKEEDKRLNELKEVLSFDENKHEEIKTFFYEEIHYNGNAYRFNDNGFVDSKKLDEQSIEREKKDD